MNKQYIRNGMEYYMKVEAEGGEEYEYRMLAENRIEGLLPLQIESMDQKQYLTFSVSGCKPFWVIGDKLRISGRQMHSLVDSILGAAKNIKEYFLSPDNLVLETDSLFLDMDSFRFHFLYVPGYEKNILSQMAQLAKILLEKADKQDNDSVLFAYGFYRVLQEETVDLEELKQYVERSYFGHWEETGREQHGIADIEQTECISPAEERHSAILPEKQRHTTKKRDRGKRETKNPRKKNSGIFIRFLAVFLFVGIFGICWALYQIYYYGILEWKRNFLIAAVGFTVFMSLVLIHAVKKRIRDQKAASVLILPREEGMQTEKEKQKAKKEQCQRKHKERQPGEEKRRMKRPQVPDHSLQNVDPFSNATMLLTKSQPQNSYPRLVYRHKNEEQHTAILSQGAGRPIDGTDRDIIFTHFPFIVGSCSFGVDYSLKEKQISRFHASFSHTKEEYVIKDLNSTNGTFVNGKHLEPEEQCVLSNGDCVAFADIDFIWLV